MSIDLDMFNDDDLDGGINSVGDIGMPPPRQRLEPIITRIGRSLEEILELEVELIEDNTEVDAELWIHLFAARFRAIMEEDSSGTKSQIKRKLYIND